MESREIIGRKVMTESCRKTWASAQTPGTQMRIQCNFFCNRIVVEIRELS